MLPSWPCLTPLLCPPASPSQAWARQTHATSPVFTLGDTAYALENDSAGTDTCVLGSLRYQSELAWSVVGLPEQSDCLAGTKLSNPSTNCSCRGPRRLTGTDSSSRRADVLFWTLQELGTPISKTSFGKHSETPNSSSNGVCRLYSRDLCFVLSVYL